MIQLYLPYIANKVHFKPYSKTSPLSLNHLPYVPHPTVTQGDPKTSLIINPTREGNIARFLNGINNRSYLGRRKANVKSRRFSYEGTCRVVLFTSKQIEPGDMLHYDYNAGNEGKSVAEWADSGFYDTSNFV